MAIGYVDKVFDISLRGLSGLTDVTVSIVAQSTGTADDESPVAMAEVGSTGFYSGTVTPNVAGILLMTAITANTALNGKSAKIEVQAVAPDTINDAVAGVNTAVAGVSTDVAGVSTDVAGVATDVAGVAQQVADNSSGFVI